MGFREGLDDARFLQSEQKVLEGANTASLVTRIADTKTLLTEAKDQVLIVAAFALIPF